MSARNPITMGALLSLLTAVALFFAPQAQATPKLRCEAVLTKEMILKDLAELEVSIQSAATPTLATSLARDYRRKLEDAVKNGIDLRELTIFIKAAQTHHDRTAQEKDQRDNRQRQSEKMFNRWSKLKSLTVPYTKGQYTYGLQGAEFSPKGTFLVTSNNHYPEPIVWSTKTWKPVFNIPFDSSNTFAFSPDEKILYIRGPLSEKHTNKFLGYPSRLWDLTTGQPIGDEFRAIHAAFRPDTHEFAIYDYDKNIVTRDLTSNIVHFQIDAIEGENIHFLQYSPDGKELLVGVSRTRDVNYRKVYEHFLVTRDAQTGKVISDEKIFDGILSGVNQIALSPNGRYIAGADQTLNVYDRIEHKILWSKPFRGGNFSFDATNTFLAATSVQYAGTPEKTFLFQVADGDLFQDPIDAVQAIHSPTDESLVISKASGKVEIWTRDGED